MFKKVLASSVLIASLVNASLVSADTYNEIACSTDKAFSENSCNQCFEGGSKSENSTVWGLSDLWVNDTWVDRVMYEELQDMPKMISLNPAASWLEDKKEDSFWKFTEDVKKLYNESHQGYILKSWQKVNWLESTEGSSFLLEKNTAANWENIGLLVYTIKTSPILENWEVWTDETAHKECVLFKSWDTPVPVKNEKPKTLPKTWPEQFFLLLLLAMFLAFGILRFKKG